MSDLVFLAQHMPLPPEKGGDERSWHILQRLAANHRIHLGGFYPHARETHHLAILQEFCASVFSLPLHPVAMTIKRSSALARGKPVSGVLAGNARLKRWIADTVSAHNPTAAFVSGAAMASYLEGYRLRTRAVDFAEVASEKWRQRAEASRWPLSDFYWRQERATLARDMRVAARFDHAFFASTAEMNLFSRRAPRTPAHLIALRNGVDHAHFRPDPDFANPFPAGRAIVLFAGALDAAPNIEGAIWFAKEVMTLLRHRFPSIDLWLVGRHPPRAIWRLARRDIHVIDSAGDRRPYLAHADAIIAPLRAARGIENNVLEGMAMAKPVIATPAALDGLPLRRGDEVLCSATAPGFASCVATALGGRAVELAARGRRRIEADYGWAETLKPLDELLVPREPAFAHVS